MAKATPAAPPTSSEQKPTKTSATSPPTKGSATKKSATGKGKMKGKVGGGDGKKKGEEDIEGAPLMLLPNGKEQRMKDDEKLKVVCVYGTLHVYS